MGRDTNHKHGSCLFCRGELGAIEPTWRPNHFKKTCMQCKLEWQVSPNKNPLILIELDLGDGTAHIDKKWTCDEWCRYWTQMAISKMKAYKNKRAKIAMKLIRAGVI